MAHSSFSPRIAKLRSMHEEQMLPPSLCSAGTSLVTFFEGREKGDPENALKLIELY